MTRVATLLAAAILAGGGQAQTVGPQDMGPAQREATDIIAASAIDGGFDPAVALRIGECFGVHMTDDEAAAFIAAPDVETQQAVTDGIAAHDEAVMCMVAGLDLPDLATQDENTEVQSQ